MSFRLSLNIHCKKYFVFDFEIGRSQFPKPPDFVWRVLQTKKTGFHV